MTTIGTRVKEQSHLFDLIVSKFSHSVSVFFKHVVHVVLSSAGPEMPGVDAFAIVAGVKNPKPLRNRPNEYLMGNAMRKIKAIVHLYSAISILREASSPVPAMGTLADVFHESVFEVHLESFSLVS